MSKRAPLPDSEKRFRRGKLLCRAKGNTCGAFAVAGREVCYHHGGAPGTGRPVSTGKYAKVNLPARLAARYEELKSDKDLTSVRNNIAFLIALSEEKWADLGEVRSAENWDKAIEVLKEAQQVTSEANRGVKDSSIRGKLIQRGRRKMEELVSILEEGQRQVQAEKEIREIYQEIGKLATVEQNRINKLSSTMTVEQAMALISKLSTLINEHVPDKAVRDRISRELILTLNQEAS
ncbi:MAG: hypothetical protein JST12_14650 [Armatimonadetes bacterium]|nr:hypothetical protein [Armatimonadota bacterium]